MSESKKALLRAIPLGGLGDIGRNMMLFESGENIVIVDIGLMFPSSDMLGIDVVIPDSEYLMERRDWVRAIILTHGHEDHIGAVPFLLEEGLDAPIYGTALTLGLLEGKLREHNLLEHAQLNTITSESTLDLGPFSAEFFHTCHSFPDSVGVSLMTPAGRIVHTSDYKLDPTPADGKQTELHKLQRWGDEGVILLTSDSTNVEELQPTQSEKMVERTFEEAFNKAEGRIIITTFASNVGRVQQIINVARRNRRRIGVIGRSMVNNVRIAGKLGYLDIAEDELLTAGEMESMPGHEVVIVATGSQGEPSSATVRMSRGDHRQITLREGDTVVISAAPIPGNEEFFNRTLNDIFRQGADVLYHELGDVHVSGHGGRLDYQHILELVRPRYFIPAHGEYRHLILHGRLAQEVGMPAENVFVIEDGQVVQFFEGEDGVEAERAERVPASNVLVDGLGIGDVGNVVLRDRRLLGNDGFLVCIVTLDEIDGDVLYGPEIISRGFVYMRENDELIKKAEGAVRKVLKKNIKGHVLSGKIKDALSNFCQRELGRRPMILPVVTEV